MWTLMNAHIHEGVSYVDTPGLADMKMRNEAGIEIQKALKLGGSIKLVFVVTLESGRVRSQDVTAIRVVLSATGMRGLRYSVIINKLAGDVLGVMSNRGSEYDDVVGVLGISGYAPSHVHLLPQRQELMEQANAFVDFGQEFRDFFVEARDAFIEPSMVMRLDLREFDNLCDMCECMRDSIAFNDSLNEDICAASDRTHTVSSRSSSAALDG